jgi:hypothetical protein
MPGFSYFKINGELMDMYVSVSNAIASGNIESVRDVSSRSRSCRTALRVSARPLSLDTGNLAQACDLSVASKAWYLPAVQPGC